MGNETKGNERKRKETKTKPSTAPRQGRAVANTIRELPKRRTEPADRNLATLRPKSRETRTNPLGKRLRKAGTSLVSAAVARPADLLLLPVRKQFREVPNASRAASGSRRELRIHFSRPILS